MTGCEDCAKSERSDVHWHWVGYRSNCSGCMARSIARSLHAFHALHPLGNGDKEPLRELTRRILATLPEADAKALVWRWWRIDHR